MLVLLYLILLFPLLPAQLSNMNVILTSYTVSAVTDYTFSVDKADYIDLPASTTIQITFPSQYASVLASGTHACIVVDWPITSVTLTCTVSGLTLTVAGGFPTNHADNGLETYSFMVRSLTNPTYSQYTDVFDGEFLSSSTSLFTFQSNSGSGVLITEGLMCTPLS